MPEILQMIIPIAGIMVGGLILLLPIAGLTLRFALKPALEAYAKVRETKGSEQELRLLQQRVALLEDQVRLLAPAPPQAPRLSVPMDRALDARARSADPVR